MSTCMDGVFCEREFAFLGDECAVAGSPGSCMLTLRKCCQTGIQGGRAIFQPLHHLPSPTLGGVTAVATPVGA